MKILLFLLAMSTTMLISAQNERQTVQQMLDDQAAAWNAGDIDRFMDTYWKSEDLQFVGEGGLVRGWEATLQRYRKRYPDLQTMGKLKFNLVDVQRRSKTVLSAVGQYHLTRPEVGDLRGFFTLILVKIKGQWLIVSDTTVESKT